MSAREAIAAAASTVDGVECFPTYRVVSKAGQAFVQWNRTDYPNTFGGEDYWGVVVALPNDVAAAEAWIATNKAALVKALQAEMTVTTASPGIMASTDNPAQKILTIEGHRESEE